MLCSLSVSVVKNQAGETSVRSSGVKNVKQTQLGETGGRRARHALRDGWRNAGRSAGGPVAAGREPGMTNKPNCRNGGKKYTPAIAVPLIRALLDILLRRACDQQHPGWNLRSVQRKNARRELARFYHYKRYNLLAPLRLRQKR